MDGVRDLETATPSRRRQDLGDWLSGGMTAGDGEANPTGERSSPARSAPSRHWLRRLLPGWFGGERRAGVSRRD